MPLYEYRCENCGEQFEKLRRMSEADEGVECPRCESDEVERLLSSFATAGCNAPAGSRFR
ncbi:MAG TPA: zinc ribbon domain-containing protein [Bryobacteraceae bacterium]|nr:zinc ribbon domain-containing protein [Bryobacteraceae bacterium]